MSDEQISLFSGHEYKEKYLVFDTETTGLPKSWSAPLTDSDNWPNIVSLAWATFDNDYNQVSSKEYIIKPSGFIIPKEASNIHGITQEKAELEGNQLVQVLREFSTKLNIPDIILVGHNVTFDIKMVTCEFHRINKILELFQTQREIELLEKNKTVCTMQASTNYCKLPSKKFGKYKYANLTELHTALFGKGFDGAHSASADVDACARSFFELKRLGIIS